MAFIKESKISLLNITERLVSVVADIVVIAGIIIGVLQLYQAISSEKRQNTINAVAQTRSNDFLQSYARLKTAHKSNYNQTEDSVVDDLNYIMNTYDNIALLYISDVIDRCMIKNASYNAVEETLTLSESMKYPAEYSKNIRVFLDMMKKKVCR